jgi:hypothetical protein
VQVQQIARDLGVRRLQDFCQVPGHRRSESLSA